LLEIAFVEALIYYVQLSMANGQFSGHSTWSNTKQFEWHQSDIYPELKRKTETSVLLSCLVNRPAGRFHDFSGPTWMFSIFQIVCRDVAISSSTSTNQSISVSPNIDWEQTFHNKVSRLLTSDQGQELGWLPELALNWLTQILSDQYHFQSWGDFHLIRVRFLAVICCTYGLPKVVLDYKVHQPICTVTTQETTGGG